MMVKDMISLALLELNNYDGPHQQRVRLETRQASKVEFETTNSLTFSKVKNHLTETW